MSKENQIRTVKDLLLEAKKNPINNDITPPGLSVTDSSVSGVRPNPLLIDSGLDFGDDFSSDNPINTKSFWERLKREVEIYHEFTIAKNYSPQNEKLPRNPFYHRIQLHCCRKIFVFIFSLTIFPIRVVSMMLFIILAWITAGIALMGLSLKDLSNGPLCCCRAFLRCIGRFYLRCALFCIGFLWISVKGRRAKPTEAPILVMSPHSSCFDVLAILGVGHPLPSAVAKVELHKALFYGKLLDATQPIYVQRDHSDSRRTAARQIKSRVTTAAGEKENIWTQVLIFPEGTCTNRKYVLKYKIGAFLPGVPIQPVILRWPNSLDSYTWTFDGPSILVLIWLTACQPVNRFQLEFLPVYTPNLEEQNDPRLYARNVQVLMGKAIGIPTSDYEFSDGIMYLKMMEGPLLTYLKIVWRFWYDFREDKRKNKQKKKSANETGTSTAQAQSAPIFTEIEVISELLKINASRKAFNWLVSAHDFHVMFHMDLLSNPVQDDHQGQGQEQAARGDGPSIKAVQKLFTLFTRLEVESEISVPEDPVERIDIRDYFITVLLLNYPKLSTFEFSAVIFALYGDERQYHKGRFMMNKVDVIKTMKRVFHIPEDQTVKLVFGKGRNSVNASNDNVNPDNVNKREPGEHDQDLNLRQSNSMNSSETGEPLVPTDLMKLDEFHDKMRKILEMIKFMAFVARR